MSIWHIYGGNRLTGSTQVQGAKNAVLPIMAASVLAGSETVLHNVPDLKDVTITLRILRHLGCTAERDGDTVRIDSRGMNRDFIPHDLMRELRSSVIFLGAILTRFGTASLSMPGGCELGPLPVNLHLDALRAGQAIECPTYDYTVHNRAAETITVRPAKVIVVEGILIFAEPELRDRLDIKLFVDTDADVRILRRIVRDVRDRGRDLESIVTQYLTTVKPMHEMFVEPSKRYADIIIPEGGHNQVALDFVMERIRAYVKERD